MSSTALVPTRPTPRLSRLFLQAAVITLAPAVVIVAAIGPSRIAKATAGLPPMRLHLPGFGLVARESPAVQLHLLSVLTALGIGIVLLVGVKGSTLHRTLGWTWVAAMMTGAVTSLFIRLLNHGTFSYIHLLSGWTIVTLPFAAAAARRHKVVTHARMMTGLFTGGMIFAGLFAFYPGRLMWRVFFG